MVVKKKKKYKSKYAASRAERKRKLQEQAKSRSSYGSELYSLPTGLEEFQAKKKRNTIDIVPYLVTVDTHPRAAKGDIWYERTFLIHRNIGVDNTWVVCPRTVGKPCPICEEHRRIKTDPNGDEEAAKAIKPSKRQLFNIREDEEITVWHSSFHTFGSKLLEEIERLEDEGEDHNFFYDVEGGETLKVYFKEEKSSFGSYLDCTRIDFQDREDLSDEVVEEAHNLDKILNIMTYAELEAMFLQLGDEEEEDDEDAPKKKKKKKAVKEDADEEEEDEEDEPPPKKKKKKKAVEEDEDEEDEEEEEDEPPPKKKKKKKVVEEDEDEEEEENDEEEDEPPPKKKKSTKKKKKVVEEDEEEEDDDTCVACEGTGKSSKGKKCPICKGTGERVEEEDEEEDEEEEDDD